MRIALVAPLVSTIAQPYIGGAQALLADLARGLHARGHTVTLFAREGSALEGIRLEKIAVPATVRPATFSAPLNTGTTDVGFFAQANLFLDLFLQLEQRSTEFDLIHVHAFDWPAYTCSALVHSRPVLHTLHLPALSAEINEALRVMHQRGHPLRLATVSQSCAQTYAPYTSIDHVIYNGLDVDAIPFRPTVEPGAPLLCAGRIAPEKGVEKAIEIAALANLPLVIAGGIYDRTYYEQRVLPHLNTKETRVTYVGQLDRETLWQLMGRSAALLCPIAWDEPFGLTPVEAMATGTPVVAFRRGALPEIIQHGQTGFLVEPDDCSQAAASLAHLHTIARVSCRASVEQRFTLENMLNAYEQVYQDMRQNRSKDDEIM